MKKKDIYEFIKKKIRKKAYSSDFYKAEMPEHIEAFLSSSKDMVFLSFILIILLNSIPVFYIFSISFFLYQTCKRAIESFHKLNKLHRIIKDEKQSIETYKHAGDLARSIISDTVPWFGG